MEAHAARRIRARRPRRQDPSTPLAQAGSEHAAGLLHGHPLAGTPCSQQVPYIFVCTAVQRLLNQVPINNIISLCTRTCAFVCVCLGTRVCVAPCSTLVDGRPSASARRRRRPVFPLRLIDHVHRPWPPSTIRYRPRWWGSRSRSAVPGPPGARFALAWAGRPPKLDSAPPPAAVCPVCGLSALAAPGILCTTSRFVC